MPEKGTRVPEKGTFTTNKKTKVTVRQSPLLVPHHRTASTVGHNITTCNATNAHDNATTTSARRRADAYGVAGIARPAGPACPRGSTGAAVVGSGAGVGASA